MFIIFSSYILSCESFRSFFVLPIIKQRIIFHLLSAVLY